MQEINENGGLDYNSNEIPGGDVVGVGVVVVVVEVITVVTGAVKA